MDGGNHGENRMSDFYLSLEKLLKSLDCSIPLPGTNLDFCVDYIEEATSKCDALVAELKTLRDRNGKLEARCKELERAVLFYADPAHWTIDWVEGSFGDYGNRARKVLEELDK